MKTIATFCVSPMPSHRMDSGIQVMEGSGRSRETNGSMIAFAGRHTPMTMPSGTATSVASAKPRKTRCAEISTSVTNSPRASTMRPACSTSPGDGRKIGAIQPDAVAAHHSSSAAATEATLMTSSHCVMRNRPASGLGAAVARMAWLIQPPAP